MEEKQAKEIMKAIRKTPYLAHEICQAINTVYPHTYKNKGELPQ